MLFDVRLHQLAHLLAQLVHLLARRSHLTHLRAQFMKVQEGPHLDPSGLLLLLSDLLQLPPLLIEPPGNLLNVLLLLLPLLIELPGNFLSVLLLLLLLFIEPPRNSFDSEWKNTMRSS